MPFRVESQGAGRVATMVCEGTVTARDFSDATREVLAWGDEQLQPLLGCLVDVSRVTSFDMTAANVDTIVALDIQLARRVRSGLLVAVAAPNDLFYGMSRMWQALAEATGWEILILRDRAEAVTWLCSRVHQKFGAQIALE